MQVTTEFRLSASTEKVWPLLCDSAMTLPHRRPVFCLGTPRPVEWLRRLATAFVYIGVKSVHRYVFRNWQATLTTA